MNDWSHGYDVSEGYTYGAYREMAPDWIDLCARIAGYVPRQRPALSGFRYLELGCGQGMGLCLLAAANPQAEFLGVDFHPGHIAHAESVAQAAGLTNITFSEADFTDLAANWPGDFGTFDYVALHGVYSWVPPTVRDALITCLHQATHPGSLVYNSYNCQPGWLGTIPFQHITRQLKKSTGLSGAAVFEESTRLFDGLRAGNAAIFQILPGLKARVESVKARNSSYLIQEYLHDSWNPLWHSEVVEELGRAKLSYIGSATMAETMLPHMLPPPLREAILSQPNDGLRQDLQDIVINQSFRRDIFCRGPRRGFGPGFEAGDSRLHLLARPTTGDTLTIETAFGELSLQRPAFAAILNGFEAAGRRIETFGPFPATPGPGLPDAVSILILLLHAGVLGVGAVEPMSADAAQRLNAVIARDASGGAPYDHIAAAALGTAVATTTSELMMLDAWLDSSGRADAAALTRGVADRLAKLDRKAEHHGKLPDPTAFLEQTLPRWRALGALSS